MRDHQADWQPLLPVSDLAGDPKAAAFRDQLEDIPKLKVRNSEGQMVPLGSLARIKQVNGPLVLTRRSAAVAKQRRAS